MNKKIYKGYELAEAVDNGILSLEQKVKSADNMTYFECTIDFVLKDVAKNIMFEDFELLEDNTEEIEELETVGYITTGGEKDIKDFVKKTNKVITDNFYLVNKIIENQNKLVRAVNQIRKEKE